ncbi:MAG: fibrobacter succinogenes major paralogous domain-containing protein [Fibromonadaceae bacterium]|jgi:uncharacterized protein (TIGR02145 family)|nr:fibrobacter succinogenes major paralogous domain-containing protein [Fibromonadaceae bacterium]
MNKLKFILSALILAFQITFAQGLSKMCIDDFRAILEAEGEHFVLQNFLKDLPATVTKIKGQEKAGGIPIIGGFLGPGSDDKMTDIGITIGCAKTFPESPAQIKALLKDVSSEITKIMATRKTGGRKSTASGVTAGGSNMASAPVLEECDFVFNPERRFCYDGAVYDKCDGMEYNPTTHICSGVIAHRALCNDRQYNPLTQFCNGNDVLNKCNGSDYNPTNQRCESNVIETQCGSAWYDVANANLRCQSNVVETRCGTVWYNPVTEYCSNGTKKLYGFVTHGGQTYKTVEIGEQIWMAENLNFAADGSVCYGNLESNCDIYGRLYNWNAAMNNAASSNDNPSGVQGVCPPGWHLPSRAEWDALVSAAGGASVAGKSLKAVDTWNFNATHVGTDDFGFSALPGGDGYSSGNFSSVGYGGYWWCATEFIASYAWFRSMGSNFSNVYSNSSGKSDLFSVRCVKD